MYRIFYNSSDQHIDTPTLVETDDFAANVNVSPALIKMLKSVTSIYWLLLDVILVLNTVVPVPAVIVVLLPYSVILCDASTGVYDGVPVNEPFLITCNVIIPACELLEHAIEIFFNIT